MKNYFIVFAIIFTCSSICAAGNGIDGISFRPTPLGGAYLTIDDTNLTKDGFSLGTYFSYSYKPFQLTESGSQVDGILDHVFVQHLQGSVRIFKRFGIGIDAPVAWWVRYKNPDVVGSARESKTAFGDIHLSSKIILNPLENVIGVSLNPFISLPSGKPSYFLGSGNITGGSKLTAEIKPFDRFSAAIMTGILLRNEFNFRNIEKGHQLLLGASASARLTKNLFLIPEINTSTPVSNAFSEQAESPTEATGALRYLFHKQKFAVTVGSGAGILKGSGAPSFRTFAGLAYSGNFKSDKKISTTIQNIQVADTIKNSVVYYKIDSVQIQDDYVKMLGQVADAMRANPNLILTIAGYADKTGPAKYNQQLSKKRAEGVKKYLMLRGVEENQITVEGRGVSSDLLNNRRVQFEVSSKK